MRFLTKVEKDFLENGRKIKKKSPRRYKAMKWRVVDKMSSQLNDVFDLLKKNPEIEEGVMKKIDLERLFYIGTGKTVVVSKLDQKSKKKIISTMEKILDEFQMISTQSADD